MGAWGALDREDLRAGEELSDDDDDDGDGDGDDDKADAVVPDTPNAQQDQTGAVPLVRIQNGTHPPAPTAAHRRSPRIRLARTAAAPPARTACARTPWLRPCVVPQWAASERSCRCDRSCDRSVPMPVRCGAVQVLRRKRIGGSGSSSGARCGGAARDSSAVGTPWGCEGPWGWSCRDHADVPSARHPLAEGVEGGPPARPCGVRLGLVLGASGSLARLLLPVSPH